MSRLDAAGIQEPLTELSAAGLEQLEVFSSIASTNTHLVAQAAPGVGRYRVAVADHQTSGRGRHFRRWISAPGAGLCLSCAYTFDRNAARIEGLTLAIGVATIGALQQLGVDGVSLKWPNDIVARDGKLGGILTEVQAGGSENVTVVTGIGMNVNIAEPMDFGVESDWAHRPVDLGSVVKELPARELLAGTLIDHLYLVFRRFDEYGLAGFLDEWRRHDWLRGKEVTVDMPDKQVAGVAAGVDDNGVLLVETADGTVPVISGSIVINGYDFACDRICHQQDCKKHYRNFCSSLHFSTLSKIYDKYIMTAQTTHLYTIRASYGCCALTDATCLPYSAFFYLLSCSQVQRNIRSTKEKKLITWEGRGV